METKGAVVSSDPVWAYVGLTRAEMNELLVASAFGCQMSKGPTLDKAQGKLDRALSEPRLGVGPKPEGLDSSQFTAQES